MIQTILVSAIFFVLTLVVIRVWLNTLEKQTKTSDDVILWLKDVGSRIDFANRSIDEKLSHNMDSFNKRLDTAAKVIGEVQKNIGEFSAMGKSMKDLQEYLTSPKLRGNIGEQVLKELLAQHLPHNSFILQHAFKSGEKVDAVIRTSQGLVPIDSKFPMENFRKYTSAEKEDEKNTAKKDFERDVRKHITDISRKYILTAEQTLDYALMYIPSEAVYYEIINNQDLFDFAGSKRILPVSPMSFYAYLKAILMSFEGQRIEEQAKEILQALRAIQKDHEKTVTAFGVLSRHITNAHNSQADVEKGLMSLGSKINTTSQIAPPKAPEAPRI